MTNAPHTGASMDATETLVREKMDAALRDVRVDLPSIVAAGTQSGQRLRRRRVQAGVAAAALTAVITGAGVVSISAGVFDRATPPADTGRLEQMVPATPPGLAAAVIAALPDGSRVTNSGGTGAGSQAVEADLNVTTDLGTGRLAVTASRPAPSPPTCKSFGDSLTDCVVEILPNGDHLLTGVLHPIGTSGSALVLSRAADTIMIFETSPGTPPLTADELQAVATNQLVGLQTSPSLNKAGEALQDFAPSGDLLVGTVIGSNWESRPHRVPAHPTHS